MSILEENLETIEAFRKELIEQANKVPDKRLSIAGFAVFGGKADVDSAKLFSDGVIAHFSRGYKALAKMAIAMAYDLDDLKDIVTYKAFLEIGGVDEKEYSRKQ